MNKKIIVFISIILLCFSDTMAQNNRLNIQENIGWYNYFGTFNVNKNFSIHSEYQFRRANYITDWQQSLLRLGINYNPINGVQIRMGYGWIETFNYGDIPLNSMGKQYTEHRLFQMLQLSNKIERFELSHRFMLEQRWVGRYSSASLNREDEYPYLNRLRYMFRVQTALKGKEIIDKTPYFAMYDEIFMGFGKNVNQNVFDQNRIALLLGYRYNRSFRIEAGYINQTVQFGRLVNGQNVFQYNNGIILNTYLNF